MADHEEQASASSVDVPAAVVEQAAASSLSDQHGSTSPTVVSPASSSAASPTATASTAEDTSSSAAPAVDNSADEAARPPPRRLRAPHHRRKNAPLPKSILKHPAPRPSGFSFRRDWLQPLNSRLAYAAAATTAPAQGEPATATATAAGQAIGNAAAGFWGSALKKLSGVTAVAAGVQVPPPRRDLAEDGPGGVTAGSSEGFPVGSGATCTSEKPLHAVADHGVADAASYEAAAHARSPPSAASSSAAPHQPPARSVTTSSAPSSSPYATIRVSSSTAAPSSSQPPPLSVTELKRVRFRMATLKVVYPINGPNGPLAPWEEGLTKKRVNMEHRALQQERLNGGGESKGWSGESLGRLYAECCRTREEKGIERVRRAFKDNPKAPPKVLDLSNELLSHGAVEALADLLSVDWGLKKLVLESCGLDDESLRPLLHALLVSGSIPTLSLANNKRIKVKGWKLIAVFVRKARFLRYLDVSENMIDKRAADHLVQALTPHLAAAVPASPAPPPAEEAPSEKEEPDEVEEGGEKDEEEDGEYLNAEPLFKGAPLLKKDDEAPEAGVVMSIRLENCGLKGAALEAFAHGVRASALKHISIRRNRINPLGAVALAIMIRDYPLPTDAHHDPASTSELLAATTASSLAPSTPPPANNASSSSNSVSARQSLQAPYVRKSASPGSEGGEKEQQLQREAWQNSEASLKLRKQIEELPRTGSLLTLDVKGNEIRNGVVYIAQVLKRNRTLKVLNLSENKIDMQGLVAIAEALKYNSTLETLDMSLNPCCGPGLDGITALRAAITIHSNLKRVFLNSTDLSSAGAIALAEFLPEATSLIHLDLTGNFEIEIAGVLALSVAVKMNHTLRCLDLNIPPNDPDFARLSQEILQCCIRNTEQAQEEATSIGKKVTISAPILKSAVARDLKSRQEAEDRQQRRREQQAQSKDEILAAAEEVRVLLGDMLGLDERAKDKGVIVQPSEVVRDALVQAQLAEAQLAEAVAATRQGDQKDRAVVLGDQLTALLDRAKTLYDPPTPSPAPAPFSPAPRSSSSSASPRLQIPSSPIPTSPADSPSSPGFVLEASDDDDEEESEGSRAGSPTPAASPSTRTAPALSHLHIPSAEDGEVDAAEALSPRSPMESQSRSLTLEEGEVFRKGAALGTGEVDEDEEGEEVSGEELRKEILETPVARSPRPSFSGGEGDGSRPAIVEAPSEEE